MGILCSFIFMLVPLALVAIQIGCVIHAVVKRKESVWIYALIFAPFVGAVVYIVTQILPTLRHTSLGQIQLPMFQKMKVKELEAKFQECDTVDNRVELAEIYAKFNRDDEALAMIKDCMTGPCKDSPDLIFTFAVVQFQNGNAAEALVQLDKLDAMAAKNKRKDRQLLRARILDSMGKYDEAEEKFKDAFKGFDGEEARYWLADFLMRRRRYDEAIALAELGIAYYKKSESLYKRVEAYWYSALKMVANASRKQRAMKTH